MTSKFVREVAHPVSSLYAVNKPLPMALRTCMSPAVTDFENFLSSEMSLTSSTVLMKMGVRPFSVL